MTHEPPRKPRRPPPLEAASEGPVTNERPTVNPPFDVEAFARHSTGSPGHGAGWSPPTRVHSTDTPTARPPAPDGSVPEPRPEQITLTNEVELERARLKSAGSGSDPSGLGAANARTDPPRFHTPSVLSMANARAPSVPNLPVARNPSPSSIEAAVLGALGNAGPEITERTIEDPIAEMRERLSLGDYTGALEMAELLLTEDPGDAEAAECAAACRGVLEGMYAARLGALDRVPSVIVQRTQLRWLSIDHRAGFVLSLVDGRSSLDMILDVCGMPRLDAMKILHELVQQKIVALKG
jgi:hypothetical protein